MSHHHALPVPAFLECGLNSPQHQYRKSTSVSPQRLRFLCRVPRRENRTAIQQLLQSAFGTTMADDKNLVLDVPPELADEISHRLSKADLLSLRPVSRDVAARCDRAVLQHIPTVLTILPCFASEPWNCSTHLEERDLAQDDPGG